MRLSAAPLPADLNERLAVAQRKLAGDRHVLFAYVFGGVGRGRVTPLSDVDIAVYLDDTADASVARLELLGTLTKILGSDAVDLVVLNNAPLSLSGRIQHSARVLVDHDPERRYEYESLTRRMFCDFQFVERKILHRRYGLDG